MAKGEGNFAPSRLCGSAIKLFMLPQVNDGGRLLAAFIHHESDSAHENNLAEKCAEVNSKTIYGTSVKFENFFQRF
jgi:hypothetical protein